MRLLFSHRLPGFVYLRSAGRLPFRCSLVRTGGPEDERRYVCVSVHGVCVHSFIYLFISFVDFLNPEATAGEKQLEGRRNNKNTKLHPR